MTVLRLIEYVVETLGTAHEVRSTPARRMLRPRRLEGRTSADVEAQGRLVDAAASFDEVASAGAYACVLSTVVMNGDAAIVAG